MLQVRQCLSHGRFDSLAISLYLTEEHRSLYGGDTKVRYLFFVGITRESALRFLFDEECRELVLYDLEDKADKSLLMSLL
jgi:hypothetical protein